MDFPNALPPTHELLVDGQLLNAYVFEYRNSGHGSVEVIDSKDAALLRELTVAEAEEVFDSLYFTLTPPSAGLVDEISFWFLPENAPRAIDVQFRIHPQLEQWDRAWSFAALGLVVEDLVLQHPIIRPLDGDGFVGDRRDWSSGISFILPVSVSPDVSLQNIWDDTILVGLALVREAAVRLDNQRTSRERSIEQSFEFPAPVRAACEQYLLYFVQFLRDLGIEADAALTEHASEVLFSVTPRSESEALAKIRDALDLYLALADNPQVFEAYGLTDVAVQQLSANVFHLRSQLQLANAVMAAKDAQIDALRIIHATLNKYALPATTHARSPDEEQLVGSPDEEQLVEGLVSVKPYDMKGVRINLPEILRRLKRRLGN